jgi:thioredoxin reductase (NADPH)
MNDTPLTILDVIIIGAGPAGATAALYAARAGLKTRVLDKGLHTGALGQAGRIANYPGLVGEVSGAELLAQMRAQAEAFGAEMVQDKVLGCDLSGEIKTIWTNGGMHQARAVIIASGSMGATQTIPGEERLVGMGVSYCATCDAAFFKGADVAVVGSNQEAAEEALFLAGFAARVHLLTPTAAMRVSPETAAELAEHPRITPHPSSRVSEIVGERQVDAVRYARQGGEPETLAVSGVFLYLQGRKPITDFLQGQVLLSETGCVQVDGSYLTSAPGVAAVGDVLCQHLRQVVVAAGDGAQAAMAVQRYLTGREQLRPDWA